MKESSSVSSKTSLSLNEMANKFYNIAKNHGFHENDNEPNRLAAFIANLHGEVSELWEAYREGKLFVPCDKSHKMEFSLTCMEEELADIIIRALDTAATYKLDIEKAIMVKSNYNESRPFKHGDKLA